MAHTHFMNLALAVEYGTNESLFLTNLCFWIEKNKANKVHFHKGRYWVYNTMDAWAELFPYFTKDQIRHLIDKMKRKKILLVGTFNRTRYDRTQWYSVNDEALSLYTSGSMPEKTVKPEEKPIRPPGQMDVVDLPHPSAPQGEWMWEKSHIEAGDFPDRSAQIPTPIPDNKPDKKQADVAAEKIPKGQMPEPVENREKTAAAESYEIKKLQEDLSVLDYRLVFDTSFYPKAAAYLVGERLDETYLSWLYGECLSRKPENLRGLYYALFFQNDMLALFREGEKKKEAEKPIPVICPVCGITHDPQLQYCPQCNFSRIDAGDEEKIRRHKKFYALSPEDKAAYEREQGELFSLFAKDPAHYDAVKDKWKAIDKKYRLLE
jgi:Zn-finger nucleic acid-binding protein